MRTLLVLTSIFRKWSPGPIDIIYYRKKKKRPVLIHDIVSISCTSTILEYSSTRVLEYPILSIIISIVILYAQDKMIVWGHHRIIISYNIDRKFIEIFTVGHLGRSRSCCRVITNISHVHVGPIMID